MNMQDKELDNLFHSKLDGFETEPSASVWENIDTGLTAGKRKRILLPLLSAAASIIVLVTAGILLAPRHVQDPPHHPVKGNIAKNEHPPKATVTALVNPVTQVARINTGIKPNKVKQTVAVRFAKKQPFVAAPQNMVVAAQLPAIKQPAQDAIASVQ